MEYLILTLTIHMLIMLIQLLYIVCHYLLLCIEWTSFIIISIINSGAVAALCMVNRYRTVNSRLCTHIHDNIQCRLLDDSEFRVCWMLRANRCWLPHLNANWCICEYSYITCPNCTCSACWHQHKIICDNKISRSMSAKVISSHYAGRFVFNVNRSVVSAFQFFWWNSFIIPR